MKNHENDSVFPELPYASMLELGSQISDIGWRDFFTKYVRLLLEKYTIENALFDSPDFETVRNLKALAVNQEGILLPSVVAKDNAIENNDQNIALSKYNFDINEKGKIVIGSRNMNNPVVIGIYSSDKKEVTMHPELKEKVADLNKFADSEIKPLELPDEEMLNNLKDLLKKLFQINQ